MDGAERRRNISIHALREEGDAGTFGNLMVVNEFLSTPSARRATDPTLLHRPFSEISIHALREEGDCRGSAPCSGVRHFYPRPPRGGRPVPGLAGRHHRGISIHALREEGDFAAGIAIA